MTKEISRILKAVFTARYDNGIRPWMSIHGALECSTWHLLTPDAPGSNSLQPNSGGDRFVYDASKDRQCFLILTHEKQTGNTTLDRGGQLGRKPKQMTRSDKGWMCEVFQPKV